MINENQVPNALLYLTSTSAQVWSALLVFYILLLRDLEKSREEKKNQIWNVVNEQTSKFRTALLVGLDNAASCYERFDFNRHDIKHCPTEWVSFERFLEWTAMSGLILQEGKNLGIADPQTFWETLSVAHQKVITLNVSKTSGPQASGFKTGMALIGINLIALGLHPLLSSNACLCEMALIIATTINLAFGFRIYSIIKASMN